VSWCVIATINDVIWRHQRLFGYKVTSFLSHQFFFMSLKKSLTPPQDLTTSPKVGSKILLMSVPWANHQLSILDFSWGSPRPPYGPSPTPGPCHTHTQHASRVPPFLFIIHP
jgi:hypothetical protein